MEHYFSDKTVLVTGAAGLIGSHLCDQLLAFGARVIGVDNLLSGRTSNISHLENNERFQLVNADVIQPVANYLPESEKPDIVLHFASPASPPLYQQYPIETYQVNSLATHYLLEYARDAEARFLFASTSEVYGDPEVHPQPETYWGNVNPNGLRACYDEGKRLGETICGVFSRDYGVDVRIVRIFNTYGPRINPRDGRVIPQFISEALAGQPYSIHGDGSQTRSYCYVSDLVEGILLMAAVDEANGETVNLGNPEEYTVLETASFIHQVVNPGVEPQFAYHPLPNDDPTRRRPDIAKAKQLLGWEPKVSFEEGLSETVEYFRHAE